MADRILPAVKKIAGISTLTLLLFVLVFHGRALLSALGTFAVAAQVLFVLGMALVSYLVGFGMNQAQRGAMALGVCSRNGGAMLVAFSTFSNPDPRLLVMLLLAVPVPFVVWLALARFFAFRAGKAVEGAVA